MKLRLSLTILTAVFLTSELGWAIEARLRVGVVRPKTGASAALGQELWQGVELALEQHKSRTPAIENLVELVDADDAGSPSGAAQAAEDLLRRQRVHAVIGSVNNHVNQSVADAAVRLNRLTFLPFATQDQLTSRSDMLFSVSLSEQEQGRIIGQFTSGKLQRRRALVLVERDNPYSMALATGFRQDFTAGGGQVLAEMKYDYDGQSDSEILEQLPSRLDTVFIPGFVHDANRLIRQIKPRLSASVVFIGGDGWDDPSLPKMLPASAGSYYYFTPFHLSNKLEGAEGFVQTYQRRYRSQPSAMAYFGYASMDTLLATYLRANSNRSEALARQLRRPQDVNSLLGPFQVTKDGTIYRPGAVMTISSGQTRFHEVVEPQF